MFKQKGASDELNQSPGLICPQCGFRIHLTIELLLNNPSICCSECGLELSIDQEKSKAALNALQRAYRKARKIEDINI
jgi:predicted amidophosphoribosyltransferase